MVLSTNYMKKKGSVSSSNDFVDKQSSNPSDSVHSSQPTSSGDQANKPSAPLHSTEGIHTIQDLPWRVVFFTFFAYGIVVFYAYFHHLFLSYFYRKEPKTPKGYAPLIHPFTSFYSRYMYGRVSDCFGRPICSAPGPWIDVMERAGSDMFDDLRLTGKVQRCLNLGSYNYLGFAENSGTCTNAVLSRNEEYSSTTASPRANMGNTVVHQELERLVARFVGKEDAVVFGMGYATNSTNIMALVSKGSLIISDNLNHASLIVGIRKSAAKVKIFKHNDLASLEKVLREAIIQGQPRTHRPWNKILIFVEGIYSMEGEIVPLPQIVALKKKYKAYLYVDEAHSIGALGKKGGGVCDYFGIDPADVDILMGTFTKSFGSAGGYIAGSKELISWIRATSLSYPYDTAMPVPVAQQILTSMTIIMGEDGTNEGEKRLTSLRNNSNYFRRRLSELGFTVFGSMDSPIIPIMMHNPNKMTCFTRTCLRNNIGVVIVGYPATPLLLSRARFCISAAHTIEDLERAIQTMGLIGEMVMLSKPGDHSKTTVLN
jgi:serine palmitoyltransferase